MLAAASAASLAIVSGAFAGTTGTDVTVSVAGSTALKNWLVANTTTFTDIQPYVANPTSGQPALDTGVVNIGGNTYPNTTTYPLTADGGSSYWNNNGGVGQSYQLAPKSYMGGTTNSTDPKNVSSDAVRFEYHESGSVEGILELANDQLYTNGTPANTIAYVTANVDRNPEGGNAVWVNYNQIGTSGVKTVNPWTATGVTVGGYTLGNFYASGVGQTGTTGATTAWTPGNASNPVATFNAAGVNAAGGQNAVQAVVSDAVPQQVFQNDYGSFNNTYTDTHGNPHTDTGAANTSFNSSPLDQGYGSGNSKLPAGQVGTPGFRAQYQLPDVLQVNPSSINPRTGVAFGAGPWTSASDNGLGNLNSQLTAITATLFTANPGTGLTQVNRTDAAWLQTASRLANGAGFNMTTRDVNSGTRDVAALDTGVDPSFATGKNDDGNGNLPTGATKQVTIGPAFRFSNKTAGGAELRSTVQSNRMAVGTLSINDAHGSAFRANANPIRALNYSDSVDGSTPYVQASYATISNGTYVIYQNEQIVTVKDMTSTAAYNASGVTTDPNTGGQVLTGTIQGDTANGDVKTLINNTENSVGTAASTAQFLNPADGLISQGYLVPSLMQVRKNFDGQGLNNSVAGAIDTGSITSSSNMPSAGGNFNQTLYNSYSTSGLQVNMTVDDPSMVFAGSSTASFYGANTNTPAPTVFNSNILITDQAGFDSVAHHGGNWLFGNFNQNGIRDYSALKTALAADRVLIADDQAAGATLPGSALTLAGDGLSSGTLGLANTAVVIDHATYGADPVLGALANMNGGTGATKGDLVTMGDFAGTGHFDGASLVAFAENAALADAAGGTTLVTKNYQNGVSVKNAAMDYLNSTIGTTGADAYIRQSGRAVLEGTTVPAGATPVMIGGVQVTDPVSNALEFTYDPTGVNTFNKSDVNADGVVDFNDAVVVDNENGQDYSNLGEQVNATMPAPVTGTPEPLNLVMAKQSDGNTVIDGTDVTVVNNAMTGTGNTNWYANTVNKTGPSTITWARTGGTVTVYAGATLQISNGTVQVGGTVDPFTNTNAALGANHVAININATGSNTAKLQLAQNFQTLNVAGLTINTATNSVLDLGNNTLIVNYGSGTDPIGSIAAYLAAGYNSGAWNGTAGVTSSAVTDPSHYGIGVADAADAGNPAGLASGQIELTYTLLGDANLDHKVNGADFAIMATNFNKAITGTLGWDQGDFNYDGKINGGDFAVLAQNFNQGVGPSTVGAAGGDIAALEAFAQADGISLSTSVPEPATLSLLAVGAMGLMARRRRRN
jgi:hypothetical protein